jgi:uncharacterized membrane protein
MKGSIAVTRKLWMTAAIVAIALTPLIGIGTAEAHGGGFGGGSFVAEAFMAAVFATGAFMTGGHFGVSD